MSTRRKRQPAAQRQTLTHLEIGLKWIEQAHHDALRGDRLDVLTSIRIANKHIAEAEQAIQRSLKKQLGPSIAEELCA